MPESLQPSYTIHRVAEMMPALSESEMESLKAGIKRDGQLVPILVFNNQIIDGRHRYWACLELGIEPKTAPWIGPTDPAGLIEATIRINVSRRHLSTSQRAALAVSALPFFKAHSTDGGSRDHVAKLFSVAPRYVQYAQSILEWNTEIFEDVAHGGTTIQDAGRAMKEALPVMDKKEKPVKVPPIPFNWKHGIRYTILANNVEALSATYNGDWDIEATG